MGGRGNGWLRVGGRRNGWWERGGAGSLRRKCLITKLSLKVGVGGRRKGWEFRCIMDSG